LVSASGSPAGFGYAGRHSDIVFISSPADEDFNRAIEALPAHVRKVKDAARGGYDSIIGRLKEYQAAGIGIFILDSLPLLEGAYEVAENVLPALGTDGGNLI
jgi:alkanesulfonate monooxygenase SsuD/methylene tetrahydromethanopterin reductase-like flavin-dependent oxidoreductase (luciferase family)